VGLVGDASKLRQVLLNLLNNAVRFTAEGEVRLRARSLEAGEGGRVLELEVEDTGRGIPEDELGDVFTRFAQAGDSAAGREGGVGLGLAIAKSIVERMRGTITVESTLGQGTVFRVSVPMREADLVPDTPVALVVGLEEGQPDWRVLVVDDNLENRLLLVRLLGEVGFDVGQAEEGASAIAQFEQWRPHLILMDMRMSGVDGFAATRRIRELPGGGDVKIAAVTASALS
jgi:anti-sigma regulatory factor (Ser/Thr protein kinase)